MMEAAACYVIVLSQVHGVGPRKAGVRAEPSPVIRGLRGRGGSLTRSGPSVALRPPLAYGGGPRGG